MKHSIALSTIHVHCSPFSENNLKSEMLAKEMQAGIFVNVFLQGSVNT
jgi:hypothetical protein